MKMMMERVVGVTPYKGTASDLRLCFYQMLYYFLIFTPWLTVMLNFTLGLLDLITFSPLIACST